MHDKLVFTAGILLESYQLTDATQLGYKPFKDKWLYFHIFKFTLLRVHDYFTSKQILLYFNCYYNY